MALGIVLQMLARTLSDEQAASVKTALSSDNVHANVRRMPALTGGTWRCVGVWAWPVLRVGCMPLHRKEVGE